MEFRKSRLENLEIMNELKNTYSGKRVFVTGHTGFKGSWLSMLLAKMGAEVVGISLPPVSSPYSLYSDAKISKITTQELFLDIRNKIELERVIKELKPDYIFHLAAQAFVQKSVKDPYETITTNVNGTTNLLLAAFMSKSVNGITVVTTDKVYKNIGTAKALNESDILGSNDPYSASKAASEIIVASLAQACNPRGIPVSTVRAGTVVGGGEWGEDRYEKYQKGVVIDPKGPAMGEDRVLRGGSFNLGAPGARSSFRYNFPPSDRYLGLGFRLAKTP